eukprot:13139584-Alexandrium_andersonii.AAC.1
MAHRLKDRPVWCEAYAKGKCDKNPCNYAHLDQYAIDAIKDARARDRAASAEPVIRKKKTN